MEQTALKLEYTITDPPRKGLPVIVAAAGSSTRMGGINKQFTPIAGIPTLARTLMRLEWSREVSSILLVVREEDVFAAQGLADRYGIKKLTDIVVGGKTRQESVLKGIERLPLAAESVLIHDGARPLVTNAVIENVAKALEKAPAVTCCVKVKDTMKQVDENGTVISTPDRNRLVAVQTPQGVWVKEYRAAAEKFGKTAVFTDDMALMEAAGISVQTVAGDYANIKITTAEDIRLAEVLLEGNTTE